jgi:hypothetical protein
MKIAVRHLVIATAWALSMAGTSTHAAVIHGCYLESTGALRILVDANKRCSSKERPIDWDQEGPPGPAGSPGGQQPSSWAIAAPPYVLHSPAKSSQPPRYLPTMFPQTRQVPGAICSSATAPDLRTV